MRRGKASESRPDEPTATLPGTVNPASLILDPTDPVARWWAGLSESERLAAIPCCDGVLYQGTENGGQGCTCWEPVYDLEQAPIDETLSPVVRPTPCETCACRAIAGKLADGTPSPEDLDDAYGWMIARASEGAPFYCHVGMRRRVAERHPHYPHIPDRDCGPVYTDPPNGGAFRWRGAPNVRVPFKLDGTPADLCAAWAARVQSRDGDESDPDSAR